MKKITLREFWEEQVPNVVYFDSSTILETKSAQQDPLDENSLKNFILNDVEVQYAIMAEQVERIALRRNNPTIACSVSSNIFFDNQAEKSSYEKYLCNTFVIVQTLYDASRNEVVGWQVGHANERAISILLEMREKRQLNKIVTYFLPIDGETSHYTEAAAYVIERNSIADSIELDDLKETPFYSSIKKTISRQNAAFFTANGFSVEELENDKYIQTLLALGHKVYILVYTRDVNLTVVITDTQSAKEI